MADTKHTPGPWRVEGHDIRCDDTPDNTGTYIATMESSRSPEETAANARLIAETPAMREALEGLLLMVVETTDGAFPTKPAIDNARALLARIDGHRPKDS